MTPSDSRSGRSTTSPRARLAPVGTRRAETLFLMGNGPSLGRLTGSEKAVIAGADSMAMNFYLRHAGEVGIIPTHYILADSDDVTMEANADVPALVARPEFAETAFWLSKAWCERCVAVRDRTINFEVSRSDLGVRMYLFKRFWDRRRFWLNYYGLLDRAGRRGRRRFTYGRLGYFWGWRPTDRIFRLNGTLTTALNIAWLLGYPEVQLVGVDLNDGLHFHPTDERVIARERRTHGIDALRQHATMVWSNDGQSPPVTDVLAEIARLYRRTGRKLYISNPASVPARLGIIPHRPIEAAGPAAGPRAPRSQSPSAPPSAVRA